MTVLEIYEKITLKAPIEQRVFLNYLNDSINEIAALHGDMPHLVFHGNIKSADIVPIDTIYGEEKIVLLPLYHNAIVDNILFLCGQGDEHKLETIRKAKDAYLQYWSEYSKHKQIKRHKGW